MPLLIFGAMVLGVVVGWLSAGNEAAVAVISTYIKPFGTIFVNLLKAVVVPVVLVSITCGIISMDDVKKVGSIGWKTLVYYMGTTAVAIIIGLAVANLFKGAFPILETADVTYEAKSSNIMDTIVNIFPSNIWSSFVNANMLQVIVVAVALGAGILVTGEKAKPVVELLNSLNEVIMNIMLGVIKVTPIGVFCLMADTVAVNGPKIIGSLAIVLGVCYIALEESVTVMREYRIRLSGMYVSDRAKTVKSKRKYTYSILTFHFWLMLMTKPSSPQTAPPIRTQRPQPIPTNNAPNMAAARGISANSGHRGGNCWRIR